MHAIRHPAIPTTHERFDAVLGARRGVARPARDTTELFLAGIPASGGGLRAHAHPRRDGMLVLRADEDARALAVRHRSGNVTYIPGAADKDVQALLAGGPDATPVTRGYLAALIGAPTIT